MASITELASADRCEVQIDSELTYDGITPVLLRINKREGRLKVTDDGRAVSTAGVAGRRVAYPDHIAFGEYSLNVSKQGVVWLPAFSPNADWLETIATLVARGSVALYERLLELDEEA